MYIMINWKPKMGIFWNRMQLCVLLNRVLLFFLRVREIKWKVNNKCNAPFCFSFWKIGDTSYIIYALNIGRTKYA